MALYPSLKTHEETNWEEFVPAVSLPLKDCTQSKKTADTKEPDNLNACAPFVTVGNHRPMIKPLDLPTLMMLCKEAPPLQVNPVAYCSYLQRTARHSQLTGQDYRCILEQTLPHTSEEELIENVPLLHPRYDRVPAEGRLYAWSDPTHLDEMFKPLAKYLKQLFVQKQELTHIASCKQGADEGVTAFLCRFHTVWTEHGGLAKEDSVAPLYIATFLGNMLEGHAQVIRMLVSNLSELSIEAFGKEVLLKDAASLFPTQKTQNIAHHMLDFQQQKGNYRNGRTMRRDVDKQILGGGHEHPGYDIQNHLCFHCAKSGHWAKECRKGQNGNHHNAPHPRTHPSAPAAQPDTPKGGQPKVHRSDQL